MIFTKTMIKSYDSEKNRNECSEQNRMNSNYDCCDNMRANNVDKWSRVVFPICFSCFNIFYWIYYLYVSDISKENFIPFK
jgi:hypothetical protein